ncbi:hypothetical protein LTR91_020639 [Friedmanniomyces endolithicus]|uniref:Uncharacterized protein n=1 Tax=Friedmanniomyces endolithicus TaxID=329885 RepID=A0AAN6H9K7_9PEZI|nr:hypothetical protein LTR94_018907 [Friedmanniomyces endolithicus]KAK0772752.1 hypothetical protein LTR59_015552 [Friedmanniomyces endolithicus]KAK0776621.1 hypothetical protein LTR38_015441 [Friedmanniomyces endolithicus]KAK0779917.1 hypothetical protein LTR75_015207 [Friedmanniomyces endolithicus]KAK0832566.1 hypothetical protein LTR03_015121 [Friedmanniomyces endolithicus]
MSSILTALGLRAASPLSPVPNLAASYIITHFALAYLVLASRTLKQIYGIDHNVSPREDLGKYGDAAVRSGKITQKQLEQLKRMESASANSVENYTLFVEAMLFETMAGVPATDVNATGLAYTVARCGYAIAYVLIDAPSLSQGYGCLILKLSEEVLVRCMVNGERVRMLIGMPRAPPGDHGGAKGLQAAQWLKRIDLGRMCHDWDQRTIERVSIRDLACA